MWYWSNCGEKLRGVERMPKRISKRVNGIFFRKSALYSENRGRAAAGRPFTWGFLNFFEPIAARHCCPAAAERPLTSYFSNFPLPAATRHFWPAAAGSS